MKSKGFTLIELLIVIAIIGILASVVLGSLNTARTKATDAAIKSNLTNIRGMASIYYDDNAFVYAATPFAKAACPATIGAGAGSLFADAKIFGAITEALSKSGGASSCVASASTWAVAVELKSKDGNASAGQDTWCVDSAGSSRSRAYGASQVVADAIDANDACL